MTQRFTSRYLSQEFTAEYDHATGELTIYVPGSRYDLSATTTKNLHAFLCDVMLDDSPSDALPSQDELDRETGTHAPNCACPWCEPQEGIL
jgi:hypothetical protein